MSEKIPAWLPPAVKASSTVMSVMGHRQQARAYENAGRQQNLAAQAEAIQLEDNAKTAVGVGQINATEESRLGRLRASRALAVAAASGGGASDPTVVNLIAKIAGESHYRAMADLYAGNDQARSMRNQAAMTRYGGEMAEAEGKQAARASRFAATATALTGAMSLYSKYGKDGDPGREYQGT